MLFLDEPTIGLDPQSQVTLWKYVDQLRLQETITVFLTTHYMFEAERCDRIAIIDQDRIVVLGSPADLKASVGQDRILSSLMQPLLFLFVLGKGLSAVVPAAEGTDYSTLMFPGVLITGVMFTAVFSAISIVWDREFGFLREMLVAPVRRSSMVIAKCLGSASIATLQGIAILTLAGLAHIPYHPLLLVGGTVLTFLVAFTITAFGLVLAVRVQSVQTVTPVMQLLLRPLMFLSGSLFPIGGNIPGWLSVVTMLNPLSYGVDATRSLFFFLPAGGCHRRGAGRRDHLVRVAGARLAGRGDRPGYRHGAAERRLHDVLQNRVASIKVVPALTGGASWIS